MKAAAAVGARHWPRRAAGVWLELRVVPVLLWSFSAIALGTALGARDRPVAAGWLAAAMTVGLLLQGVVAHCVNEITDWRSGTDRDPAPRLLSGGSKVIAAGLLDERELTRLAIAGTFSATGLGVLIASQRGWWLLALGLVGVVGAVVYTLPPAALAYVPFAGESVAFLCVWACALGGYGVQRGRPSADVLILGAAHAAICVGMLLMHHYLDRGPDARASPPKVTSVVRLGGSARRYALGWAVGAVGAATAGLVTVGAAAVPVLVAALATFVAHLVVRPDDPRSVTICESLVIVAGIAGALATAAILVPELTWLLAVPAVVVPVELAVARRWLGPPDQPSTPHGVPPAAAPQSPRRA